ncbi:MAG: hypothetical protein Q7R35_09190 [Elusimicrobiota bacterium]|nr:hypothetical protein [Elusimicrobiota bacterium]
MKNKIFIALAGAAALLAAGGGYYLSRGMEAAEVIKKLSGMRLSLELYRQEYRRLPASFKETLRAGTLEEAPELKLSRHLKTSLVRETPSMLIKDTGGWAYVNNSKDTDFGLLYIDCAHKDEKGRFWSEF